MTRRLILGVLAIAGANAGAWLFMLDHLQSTPRTLECRLVEFDPFGGRRYHTITTTTWGMIDQSSGAIVCYFK